MGRRTVLVLGLMTLSVVCCNNDDHVKESGPRVLDVSCASGCQTTGNARRVEGITADAVAYRLGPGKSSVTVPVNVAGVTSAELTGLTLEVLTSGKGRVYFTATRPGATGSAGTTGANSTNVLVNTDYTWTTVATGGLAGGSGDLTLTMATEDAGADVLITDVRFTAQEQFYCSVTAPGRRSRWRW